MADLDGSGAFRATGERHGGRLVALALFAAVPAACSDGDENVTPEPPAVVQCPGSVVRTVDGGEPLADALPHVDDAVTDRSEAQAAFDHDHDLLDDRYDASRIALGDGFGRAWTGESGGDYRVVEVDDFGIVITLVSREQCPRDADLHVRSDGGLPLFFFAPDASEQ